eukprot:Gb_15361 [translate_table: standard]
MALNLVQKTASGREFKVKDISQADFGRLEIDLAEVEMPGLMSCRKEFGPSQPFKGVRITGSLHMTIQTAVLIETLTARGAEVRWCSSNIFSTQDAAAIARDSAAVFAWKGKTLQEYWWCIERALDWGPGGGPDLIVDDGADATLLIYEGVKAEQEYEKTGKIHDPSSTSHLEFQIVLGLIKDSIMEDPKKYHRKKERLVGVSEETTTGVKRLNHMQSNVLGRIVPRPPPPMRPTLCPTLPCPGCGPCWLPWPSGDAPVLPPTWCNGHFAKVAELIRKCRNAENAGGVGANREKTFTTDNLHNVAYETGEGFKSICCTRLAEFPTLKSLESLTRFYLGGGQELVAVLTLAGGLGPYKPCILFAVAENLHHVAYEKVAGFKSKMHMSHT